MPEPAQLANPRATQSCAACRSHEIIVEAVDACDRNGCVIAFGRVEPGEPAGAYADFTGAGPAQYARDSGAVVWCSHRDHVPDHAGSKGLKQAAREQPAHA